MALPEYYEADKTSLAYAIGTDLTAWRNGDAALVVGELNSLDGWRGGYVTETDPIYEDFNAPPGNHYYDKILKGRTLGQITGGFYFQSGILCYIVGGHCVDVEGSPDTHTQTYTTANISTTPINSAFHFEKETPSGNIEKITDCLGVAGTSVSISCSERDTIARQDFACNFARSKTGSDVAVPDHLSLSANKPYNWFDLQNGGITVTYNGTDIAFNVIGVSHSIARTAQFERPDANAYPQAARYIPPFEIPVTLRVRPYDDASDQSIWGIKEKTLTASAYSDGDLDITLYYKENANRECKFTYDKMYMDPNFRLVIQSGIDSWYDEYDINFYPISSSSSLTIYEENELDNDYYTNP